MSHRQFSVPRIVISFRRTPNRVLITRCVDAIRPPSVIVCACVHVSITPDGNKLAGANATRNTFVVLSGVQHAPCAGFLLLSPRGSSAISCRWRQRADRPLRAGAGEARKLPRVGPG